MIRRYIQSGFTLIEIAIVLLVLSILLGYTIALAPIQRELAQYREVETEINKIIEHLVGFAQVNGRLPCPDTSGGGGVINGAEDSLDGVNNVSGAAVADGLVDNCSAFSGFIPSTTLGINGDIDANRNLIDPWGRPYRYHVANVNATAFPAIDFVSPNGVREEGMQAVITAANNYLVICDNSLVAAANNIVCAAGTNTIFANAVAVVLSTGNELSGSIIEAENTDGLHGNADRVYVSTTRRDNAGSEYDDVVKWISPSQLFSRMIEADQLP